MNQWDDDTLVAIYVQDNGKYKVVELPARQSSTVMSRKTFSTYEQAEQYIDDQYPTALCVQPEDIREEQTRRAG
jgi:hypothetical protein